MALSLAKYMKAAFMNRWNLLALAGGAAFSLISGQPSVFLPLLAAGEVAYIVGAASHPRFQTFTDLEQSQQRRGAAKPKKKRDPRDTAMRILKSLPVEARDRFKTLRSRLLELREIADQLRRHQEESGRVQLEGLQLEGLDRLLWVFLRLQYTQASIGKFLDRTDEDKIVADIERLESRLNDHDQKEVDDADHHEKVRATLLDNMETSKSRLENYRKAEDKHEYIDLELDRLENKITSLAEMKINRDEPSFITRQVDQVADSMLSTEETLSDLDFVTHLGPVDDEPPELLRDVVYITE